VGDGDVRQRVVVSGRVQGVFFRASLADEAERLGVRGWARNRADGRVEAVFEGEAAPVAAIIAWCHDGPPRARVTAVDVDEEPVRGEVGFGVG
jgi:acylphosphatase